MLWIISCLDSWHYACFGSSRFTIEQKLRKAKKKEKLKAKRGGGGALDMNNSLAPKSAANTSQRSQDRRKNMEESRQQKDSKKFSALKDLKARREEKKKQGKWTDLPFSLEFTWLSFLHASSFCCSWDDSAAERGRGEAETDP